MEKTLLGVIQVDPRRILEDGLRKETVRQVSLAMHQHLAFPQLTPAEIGRRLVALAGQLLAFRRSVEYVQDYIDLAGLKIWQEEIARIINYNVEQECNRYVKRKIFDRQSRFQSRAIPIPRFPAPEGDATGAVNFMGRVMSALLSLTDATKTVHAPEYSAWYKVGSSSSSSGADAAEEVCGMRTFALLNSAIGTIGLRGLDRLMCFRIVHELNSFLRFYAREVHPQRNLLEYIREALFPASKTPPNPGKLYAGAAKKVEKLMLPMLKAVRKIGQAQLIRRQIANVLRFSCRIDANLLYQAVDTLNKAVLSDVRMHYRRPDSAPLPAEDNPLLEELGRIVDACGADDPMAKVFVTSTPLEGMPVLLMLFVLSYMPKLEYDREFATLVRKRSNFPLDGAPLVAGVATVLKQFHPVVTRHLLSYLGQFVRSSIQAAFQSAEGRSQAQTAPEVLNVLMFMDHLCAYAKLPRSVVYAYVPPYVIDCIRTSS
mmetsp:Transcript_15176/g.51428  ORF Transcript_15176/g.51428 Transcript_15176/m.51428 type:complete len:486 (+) Transcript_15176:2-1459(+)